MPENKVSSSYGLIRRDYLLVRHMTLASIALGGRGSIVAGEVAVSY
jgi:hypothetical protein